VTALGPGGWLVIEDYGLTFHDRGIRGMAQRIAARVAGREWGRSLYQRLCRLGLVEVGMQTHRELRRGGTAGARMDRAGLARIRQEAVASGLIAVEDLDRLFARLDAHARGCATPEKFGAWGHWP